VDGGYRGSLLDWVKVNFKEEQKGFVILPRRWVVERTFAWLSHQRRLSKDYEVFPKTSETFILIAMTRLMLRRLQPR
jgi:putative transposase